MMPLAHRTRLLLYLQVPAPLPFRFFRKPTSSLTLFVHFVSSHSLTQTLAYHQTV